MFKGGLLLVLTVATLAMPALAQEREGGAGPGSVAAGSGLPSDFGGPRTIPQQFAAKLKLDKTQGLAVDQILTAAATHAAPRAAQMLQARQQLLNALRAKHEDEVKVAQQTYAAAAADVARIEGAAFAKVYGMLKPNQQKDGPQAFALIAGLFSSPATSNGAARGGSRGGPGAAFPFSRLESLQQNFKLDGDKKKAVKPVLDEANRSAAPVREALLAAHAALGAGAEAAASQDAIDAAARAYGEQAAAMARIEMDAIARVIAIADPDLQNPPAIQAAFFMARGMFLKGGKWDEIPEQNIPGY